MKTELKYGALMVDEFDAGQVVGEHVACQIFERQNRDFALQYASVAWKKETDPDNIPWDDVAKEERGQHWRLVYRYYPARSGINFI